MLQGLKGRAQDAAGLYADAVASWVQVAQECAPDLLPLWRDGAMLRLGPLEGAPGGRLRLLPAAVAGG